MFRTLARELTIIILLGTLAVYASAVAAWRWIELPQLLERERMSDANYIDSIRAVIDQRLQELCNTALDYGSWTDTYEFMGYTPGHPLHDDFTNNDLNFEAHQNNDVNGMLLLNTNGEPLYSTSFNLVSGQPMPQIKLDIASLDPRAYDAQNPRDELVINTGFATSNVGTVLFASAPVLKSDRSGPALGVLIVWKLMDASVRRSLDSYAPTELEFISIADAERHATYAERLRRLLATGAPSIPRTERGNLYWLQNDFTGRPLYLVRLQAEPRAFYDGWLSPPFLVAFLSSVGVLVAIIFYISGRIIRQITRASAIAERIHASGDFSERLPVNGHDELASMFTHFNVLLDRVTAQDIALRNRNEQLEDLTRIDPLTGVPNRRFLDETLERTWRQVVRAGRPISVLLIDVDYFKPFNDNYGHLRGDQVLRQVANTLQDNLHRATDYLARYGGEEFCVILTDTAMKDALMVAESLREAVQEMGIRHEHSACADVITVSIGVSSVMAEQKVLHLDLIGAADKALYHAKREGRNRVESSDRTIGASASDQRA